MADYRHVPREAAKQFARTTTVEVMREGTQVHELSKRALQIHMEGSRNMRASAAAATDNVAPAELTRALRFNQEQREKTLDRNQFQRTRILEEAAQKEHEAQHAPANPHTFEHELAKIVPPDHSQQHKGRRRNSTGNAGAELLHQADDDHRRKSLVMETLLDAAEDVTPPEEHPNTQYAAPEQRVDWSQSDEHIKPRQKLLLSPLLRRADSFWGMRVRLGSKTDKGGSSASGGAATAPAPATAPQDIEAASKSPRSGFFAKFIR